MWRLEMTDMIVTLSEFFLFFATKRYALFQISY